MNEDINRDVLSATFLSRIQLAKMSEVNAMAEAGVEWRQNRAWLKSKSTAKGSFLWYCTELDLEPSAVLRELGL